MAQRGKLLTYDAATGNGLVVLIDGTSGEKLPFAIDAWQSAELPLVGMVVDVVGSEDRVGFRPVAETDLMKEKLDNLSQQLSRGVEKTLSSDGARQAASRGASFLARLGIPALAAYVLYAGAAAFANFATVRVMGMGGGTSLNELPAELARAGGGSGLGLLLWISYFSLVLPVVWNNRKAWLAHCLPLATVLLSVYSVRNALSDMHKQMIQLIGARHTPELGEMFSFNAGFYLCLLAALLLAFHGLKKTRSTV